MEDKIHCRYSNNTHVEITTDGVQDVLHTAHDDTGKYVTPGQMLAAALGACTLTMMGAVAGKYKQSIDGATISVEPIFAPDMTGLKEVKMHISLPEGLPEDVQKRCLEMAELCPVHRSLRPGIRFVVNVE